MSTTTKLPGAPDVEAASPALCLNEQTPTSEGNSVTNQVNETRAEVVLGMHEAIPASSKKRWAERGQAELEKIQEIPESLKVIIRAALNSDDYAAALSSEKLGMVIGMVRAELVK